MILCLSLVHDDMCTVRKVKWSPTMNCAKTRCASRWVESENVGPRRMFGFVFRHPSVALQRVMQSVMHFCSSSFVCFVEVLLGKFAVVSVES